MTEEDWIRGKYTLEGRTRLIRNNCANYYYSPFIGGTDVICDGVPVKKGAFEWECTNGTTCKPKQTQKILESKYHLYLYLQHLSYPSSYHLLLLLKYVMEHLYEEYLPTFHQ